MTLHLEPMISTLARALEWWVRELVDCLPTRLRRAALPVGTTKSIKGSTNNLKEAISGLDRGTKVSLTLTHPDLLSCDLLLPFANQRATAGMVRVQSDRVLPIDAGRLYTDWRAIETTPTGQASQRYGKNQRIRLYAAKKSFLDEIGRTLDASGLRLTEVLDDAGSTLPGLVPRLSRRRNNEVVFERATVAAAAVVLFSLLPAAWLSNVKRHIAAVEQEVATVRVRGSELVDLQNRVRLHHARLDFVDGRVDSNQFNDVLISLSAISPDSVYLRELDYDLEGVRIAGFAESAAEWALQLESTDQIEGVAIRQVSTGRDSSDPESYEFHFRLVKALP